MTEFAIREQIILDSNIISSPMWQGIRVTNMINQAQDWLQAKLIKQGYENWSNQTKVGNVVDDWVLGIATTSVNMPVNVLRDLPMKHFFPSGGSTAVLKPAVQIELENFHWVYNSPVSAPTNEYPIVVIVGKLIHIAPRGDNSSLTFTSTLKITDLIYNNNSIESEIPSELQWILIERVVMQIKSAQGNEQLKQTKYAEIDKELTQKYQLNALKQEDDKDRSQPQ